MKTTNKLHFAIKLTSLLFIGILVFSTLFESKTTKGINLNTFKTDQGYGYDILIDSRIYIHQEYIPAVYGNQAFITQNQAEKTAGLVIKKLKVGNLPTVSINELDSLKISYIK